MNVGKRKFYQSLYWKLAVSFAVAIFLVGVFQLSLALPMYRSLVDEIEQQTNWDLASDIVEQIQPLMLGNFDLPSVQDQLFRLQQITPQSEYYVVSGEGKIVAYAAPDDDLQLTERVDLSGVLHSISKPDISFPLYGPDPRNGFRKEKIFSIAPLNIAGSSGYLYVILESVRYELLLNQAGQLFIIKNLLFNLLVLGLIVVVIATLVFRYLTKSFRSLSGVVGQFSQGDFSKRVELRSNDEIFELSQVINQMADRISKNDSQRRELIASISHDLRSPLTAVRGFVDLLREENAQFNDKQKHYLERLHSNILAQQTLVDDLFELSKLEAQERSPQIEAFSLIDLIDGVVMRLENEAIEKRITFVEKLPELLPRVLGDTVMIDRVLQNLVGNAVRYTPPDGTVEISCVEKAGEVEVVVKDTGIGISEADLPLIFDPFFRASRHRGKDGYKGGSGLGLAIVKKILDAHQSRIEVESKPFQGTRFSFTLPSEKKLSDAESIGI